MERQRNWLGWAALALAGLALLVALGGRFGGPRMMAYVQAPAAPAAPRFERGQPMPFADERDREFARPGRGGPEGFAPGFHGRGHQGFAREGFGHRLGLLGFAFALVNTLAKLVALGLLAWLLLRFFQQRRNGPPPAPTTPAGHDPRVE